MSNLLLRDLALANVAAFALAVLFFALGWSLISAISISLLACCAVLLVFGGALGFFLSGASFDWISKLFRRPQQREEESEVEKRRPKIMTEKEERKEQINAGKRLIIIGFILLGESLMVSAIYVSL
jgi:hypothetical protein